MSGIFGDIEIPTEALTDYDETESIDNTEYEELPLLKDYAWDFSKNEFVLVDNKFVIVEGLEALKIRIYKILKTQQYRYMAYGFDYGTELEDLIGEGYSKERIDTEVKNILNNCLVSDYILSVDSVETELQGSRLIISATIKSVYGDVIVDV